MSTIGEQGFLSEEIVSWVKEHRKVNKEYFDLCREVSTYYQKTMLSLEPHNRDHRELLTALLLGRALGNFQGMVILAERGMIDEVKVLLRCLLEIMFTVVAIGKDRRFVYELVNNEFFHQRKKDLHACLSLNDLNAEQKRIVAEELHKFGDKRKEKKISEIKIKTIAEKAGLSGMYNSAYRILSGATHASIRDLERYLELDKMGEIRELSWGPDIDGMDFALLTGIEAVLYVLEGVFQVFSVEERKEFESLSRRFKAAFKIWSIREDEREKGKDRPVN